jgi:hypothetical protein
LSVPVLQGIVAMAAPDTSTNAPLTGAPMAVTFSSTPYRISLRKTCPATQIVMRGRRHRHSYGHFADPARTTPSPRYLASDTAGGYINVGRIDVYGDRVKR